MSIPALAARRAARPSRAETTPALPPMKALDRTHRRMVEMLSTLSTLVGRLQGHAVDALARESAALICQFFADHARLHHADEETLVFPALIRANDPELTQHVLRLQQDHGWLEEDWLELEPQLQAVARGYSSFEPQGLQQAVAVFVGLYHEHIALEESLIYPEARRLLAAEAASREQRLLASRRAESSASPA